MIFLFILIIITAIVTGICIAFSFEDKDLIGSVILFGFLLGFLIAGFIYCIPDYKSQIIKDYTSGKYRKEITYKARQIEDHPVIYDSTVVYKLK